jgi:RNA polymerase sigma-70 factor (ECF subfamily)
MPVDAMPISEPAETDAERIARGLRRKDVALVNELVERYQYRLVRYLIYLTARRERVDDWVQDTWLRVLDRAAQYDGRSRFETWLFSIARNLAIDDLRRRQNAGLEAAEGSASDQASPFLAAARSEDAVRLSAALDSLEPVYREALLLRFQEEMSLQEISEVTGAPVPTVSSRIHRGLGRLRSQWEGGANAV